MSTKQIYSKDELTAREAELAHAFTGLPSKEQLKAELQELKNQASRAVRKTSKDKLVNIFEYQENAYNELVRRKILFEGRIDILATEVLGYKYEDFHKEMSEFQNKGIYESCNFLRKENRSLVMAPRGGGKSHILTYVQILYEVLVNPNIRILITSNTQGQSESFMRTISQHLTDNGTLIKIFGNQKHSTLKWDTREINIAGRTRKGRESTISCIGLGGGVTGYHFDLIIGDDLVDEENARTKHQRDYVFTWFYKTLYPTLEPDGRLYLIGTRYNPDDLYGRVEKEEFKGRTLNIPAIRKRRDGSEYSFWPDKFNLDKLYSMRRSMGIVIFNTQMQNDTTLMVGRMIKSDMFQSYKKLPPVDGFMVQGIDSASSGQDKDDFFAHCSIFITKEPLPKVYLVSFKKAKISVSQQYEYCERKHIDEDPLRTFVESNAGQAYFAEGLKAKGLRVQKIFSTKDKVTEMYKVMPILEDKRFFVLEEHADFINDMVAFPDGDDDDLPDACRIALKGAIYGKVKRQRTREPGVI